MQVDRPPACSPPSRVRPAGPGSQIELVIDEDYGFQLFFGPIKQTFTDKYLHALDHWHRLIRDACT